MTERHEVATGPYFGEYEMTVERAREAFGQLTSDGWPLQYLTFTVGDQVWVPQFNYYTARPLELTGYRAQSRMEED